MKKLIGLWTGAWLLVATSPTLAQFGPPAAAAAAPAAAAPAAAAPAAAGGGRTLWQFLGLTYENCERHRLHLCNKPIGKLLNAMTAPAGLASGGLIGPLCPPVPSQSELNKLLDPNNPNVTPAEAAAAKIKAMEAQAKARRAAVRYLGTVDCHYYPEAEPALIQALRQDPNECVRWEAALALGKGCCCTKKTVAALMITASGSNADGNFAETSPRVKAAALHALNGCVARLAMMAAPPQPPERPPETLPPPMIRPEQPPPAAVSKGKIQLAAFYTRTLPRVSQQNLLQAAARVLAANAGHAQPPRRIRSGHKGLLQLWNSANTSTPAQEEISFDEAALAVPRKPAPTAPQNQNAYQATQQRPHALIGFQPAKKRPVAPIRQAIYTSYQPSPASEPMQRQFSRTNNPPPVPWPGTAEWERNQNQSENAFPQPVPWPEPIPTSRTGAVRGQTAPGN